MYVYTYIYIWYMIMIMNMYDYDFRFIVVSCCFFLDIDGTSFFIWIAMKSWNTRRDDFDAWTLLGSLNVNHIVCRVFEISKVPGCFFGTEQVPQQLAARAKLLKCWHSWHSSPKCQGHCWALWLYMPWGSPSAASAQTVTWQHSMQLACVMWGGGV